MSEQLDAQIAETFFGYYRDPKRRGPYTDWHEAKCGGKGRCAPLCGFNLPSYSSEIAAAFAVVEKMRELGKAVDIESTELHGRWLVKFWANGDIEGECRADSLQEAICTAAVETTLPIKLDKERGE